ncbi:hypothetical protein JHK86_010928 [Glycine max]|nr:hypothetical protein JHK86_010928 [Glycine max]
MPCFTLFLIITFLRSLAVIVNPFLHPYHSDKLEIRSTECVLGYSTSHKGYMCMSPSGRIFVCEVTIYKFYNPKLVYSHITET